ncbi:MAG: SCP2 sterol-binding domain-containing protein [Actinobacteria bacterium]|nr:SCP2 sterol-binding domain-containing protein [Actinomycetota bacterium]
MATVEEVEATLHELISRLERVDPSYRAMMPSRRTIQAECPDLELVYHAFWRDGKLSELHQGAPERRPDIRVRVDSDDLMALANQDAEFRRAVNDGRVRIDASMTDLLRLRAVL